MKIAYITLGCKVNQYETQAIEQLLCSHGHTTASVDCADVVVVNTCAVTAESVRKSRQAVRRASKSNPGVKLVVCGCAAQADPDSVRALGADYIGGAGERVKVVEFVDSLAAGEASVGECLPSPRERTEIESLPAGAFDGHARAYLKVQDGCANFCTYCIIPYLRGPVRSLAPSVAADMTRDLASQGFREIVVTGIEVSSYGEDCGASFADLVEQVAKAAYPARIRLGSIEPSRVDDDTVRRLAAIPNLCPHFHLSLQSGSAGVLRRMNRKYTPDEFAAVAENLRAHFDDPALTTDIIAGFPGETEQEHRETLDFVRRIGFAAVHVFPYSKREGTVAARMPGHLTNAVKERRAHEIAEVAQQCRAAYLARQVGRTLEVLFETDSEGHSENYLEVEASCRRGEVAAVEITGASGGRLTGRVKNA